MSFKSFSTSHGPASQDKEEEKKKANPSADAPTAKSDSKQDKPKS